MREYGKFKTTPTEEERKKVSGQIGNAGQW